ncbi:MAG: prepilin-type N-terminal cleavage/methylation domain-containing protein [Candidatus Gastranaerophilales bacterium]|nr:prepilin-type N-terminal cleavage/methylation domain-containing protein [Candidatus Gastranaerophilales bacterium]
MFFKKPKGFTLAETLIVIAIIGIIASIVTPMLFGTTNQAELTAAWKKTYSDVNQALLLIKQDNGGTFSMLCASESDASLCFRNQLSSKLNYIKTCNLKSVDGNCWSESGPTDVGQDNLDNNYGLILNNGTFFLMQYNPSCNWTSWGGEVAEIGHCGAITIDVNGSKAPNETGKDIFGISILKDRVVPYGAFDIYIDTCDTTGVSCSTDYLYE